MSQVAFDERVASELLRYARMVVARGYIHNSLGNIAVRAPHPDFPHGVAYTKHAEVSLEEMTIDNVVVTDIPTPTLLHGQVPTSVWYSRYSSFRLGYDWPPTMERARRLRRAHRPAACFHAPGTSDSAFNRARTSSLRFVSCVDVVDRPCGQRCARRASQAWSASGGVPKPAGSPPTSLRETSRL